MVMDRIGGLANMSRELLEKFQGSGRALKSGPDESPEKRGAGNDNRSVPADSADISPKAHRLIALRQAMDSGKRALEDVPEVRPDRVAEARARLNRGYYNSIEVRSRVAEKLDDVARKLEDL